MNINKIFSKNVPGTTEILQKACVGIAGCGGLGSNAAVALVRAGVGRLILVDFDVVEESNLNRQHYFQTDIGVKKVTALASHLKSINPEVHLETSDKRIGPSEVPALFGDAKILIEAFDLPESKTWLVESWCGAFPDRHIVCASGLSGTGRTVSLKVKHQGKIHIAGDGGPDMNAGLCSARVAMVANMEANIAIELLLGDC
jgi:sulfur carrier protein ThiS adenylyltransferase